jgi:hypothetical protein
VFPKLQQNTPKFALVFNRTELDFGLDSFLKCTEIQPNTDLFDFFEGCSCSFVTTGKTVHHTKFLVLQWIAISSLLKKKKINGKF